MRTQLGTGSSDPLAIPDLMWDEAGTFLALADIDLPCTVVGCSAVIAARLMNDPGLEAILVRGEARLVA